jgi:glutaredoxin
VCRREGVGAGAPTRLVWGGLGAIALTIGAGVSYRTLASRSAPVTIAAQTRAQATPTAVANESADTPPARATAPGAIDPRRAEQTRLFQAAASAPPGIGRPSPTAPPLGPEAQPPAPAATVSLRDVHVVVYTTGWCSVCKRAKAWMNSQGIPYEERNIEQSSEDARKMRAINPRGSIPTFDVEGDVMVGFSEQQLAGMMQSAARRQAARRPM